MRKEIKKLKYLNLALQTCCVLATIPGMILTESICYFITFGFCLGVFVCSLIDIFWEN